MSADEELNPSLYDSAEEKMEALKAQVSRSPENSV